MIAVFRDVHLFQNKLKALCKRLLADFADYTADVAEINI
jgi:hypothetical protein